MFKIYIKFNMQNFVYICNENKTIYISNNSGPFLF